MPLVQGVSRFAIGENIRRESKKRPQKQAVAIALSTAARAAKFLAVDENDRFVAGFTVDPMHSPIAHQRLSTAVHRRLESGRAKVIRLLDSERREVIRWQLSRGKVVASGIW